jgi:dTDP-4-dehydrorhamnose reductase
MSLVILGSNGMLGSMLYFVAKTKYNLPVISIGRTEFDAVTDDIYKLDTIIPVGSCIVNCIGAIPQKKYNSDGYTALNTTFPINLSTYCKERAMKLIHVSTNCVFSGEKNNCVETDIPDAQDDYGRSKYYGEPPYGLTIRCSIIGPEKHTFCGLLEWFLHRVDGTEINGFTDSFWNGLTTLELSDIIIQHFQEGDVNDIPKLHYFSENAPSKYNMLDYIGNKFQKRVVIHPKENGLKYYTLSSSHTKARKNVYQQIDDLYSVYNDYKVFYSLK